MTGILDTNIWFLATSENLEESHIDKEEVRKHGDADKIRGAIFKALLEGDVIVPLAVAKELEGLRDSGKAKRHNKENIDRLLYIFRNRTMKIIPTRQDLTRQAAIIDALASEKETSQGFHTFSKLSQETLRKIESANRVARKSLQDQEPEGQWTTLARDLDSLIAQRETTGDSRELNKKIKAKREALEMSLPFVLADYEILLCAERTDAQIYTLDNDLQALWGVSPSLQKTKEPKLAIFRSNLEKRFNQLEPKVREKTKVMGPRMSLG